MTSTSKLNSIIEKLAAAKRKTQAKANTQQSNLTQTNSRGQLAAASALSVINIGLLQEIIEQGPEHRKHYMLHLTLISLSLGLQIAAGILVLVIAQIHNYYDKHGTNLCSDLCKRCHIFSSKVQQKNNHGVRSSPPASFDEIDLESLLLNDVDDEVLEGCGWCPTTSDDPSETLILDKYKQSVCTCVNVEMMTVRTETEIDYQTRIISDLRTQMADLDRASPPEVLAALKEALKRKRDYEDYLNKYDIYMKQIDVLDDYVNEIKRDRLLTITSFWQHMLNYILYTVFVLNAFITGFGITQQKSGNTTTA